MNKAYLPKRLVLNKYIDKVNLIMHGQGVILFDAHGPCILNFCDASGVVGLKVSFTECAVHADMLPSNEPLIDKSNSQGLTCKKGAYYWVSLDSQNQRLIAGIGEARTETMIYSYQFPVDKNSLSRKLFLESLVCATFKNLQATSILRDPITRKIPLLVKDTNALTMESISQNTHMPKVNLSAISQKLHDCIAGKHFRLDTRDFPNFVKAIEYSINTPGKWCYERLKEKATEFSKDKPNYEETYLRITLGENNGESPGIPYVMEIWPVGHYSPIHNHGSSSAIIRVLSGGINVSLFPFLSSDACVEPFAIANFKKDDVTWISPTLNQVHQLKNLGSNTCITIQCYMYENGDSSHYDYFDYIDANAAIKQFEPDSDMGFMDFKRLMKKEWSERKRFWCR